MCLCLPFLGLVVSEGAGLRHISQFFYVFFCSCFPFSDLWDGQPGPVELDCVGRLGFIALLCWTQTKLYLRLPLQFFPPSSASSLVGTTFVSPSDVYHVSWRYQFFGGYYCPFCSISFGWPKALYPPLGMHISCTYYYTSGPVWACYMALIL